MFFESGVRECSPGAWPGQAWDCDCVDAWVHGRNDDCRATLRRAATARLADARRWIADMDANETLMEQSAPDAATTVGELADCLEDLDWAVLDGDARMAAVLALEGARRRLDAAIATGMGVLDDSAVTVTRTGFAAKRWLANTTHAPVTAAGRDVAVARTMGSFPAFAEALRAGHVCGDHLLALDRAANPRVHDALVVLDDELVTFAKRHSYAQFTSHLHNLVALLDADGPRPDCSEVDTARMARTGDTLYVNLALSGHNAVITEKLLSDETDRQYRAAVAEHDATGARIPDIAVLRARAFMALIRHDTPEHDTPTAQNTPTAHRTPRRRIEAILAVVVDDTGWPTAIYDDTNNWLSPDTAALLICDAVIQPVVVNQDGVALYHGREQRLFTPAQKHALNIRDGGCVFPTCETPTRRCDAHHLIEYQHGGLTNIDSAALLCRRHHGLVHSNTGWTLKAIPTRELPPELAAEHQNKHGPPTNGREPVVLIWETPDGRTLLAQTAADHRPHPPP